MSISNEILEIPMDQIDISNLNVRKTDRESDIRELADSIKKYGLLQPVVLNGEYGKPPYELIVGQRRLLAHRLLKEKYIRAVFCLEKNETQLRMLSLSENMHRELNYVDKAEAITLLYNNFGKDTNKVAKELGLSVSTIIEYVKLEEQATPKAKELLKKKIVKKADVKRAISAAQGDPEKIDELIDEFSKLTKYEKDRAVDYGKKKKKATVKEIIEEAKKPKYEKTVILNLDQDTNEALTLAGDTLSMDREEIAVLALTEWLEENDFLKQPGQQGK